MITHNSIQYEALDCSYPDGFATELWQLPRVDGQQCIVTVYLPESGDDYEIERGPTELPNEIIESFISEAKSRLQQWRAGWMKEFPVRRSGSA
jgi:hypothetical protein